ncbi:hypothetical protein B0J13DRAFT_318784 [Dactylonectria estremocensis]|uniref:Uncharacterized protein n=1 Tax=Dactylonectria estremocensis TaxID=1079267 RepID=A0A9P9EXA8_9HYPO|nr:hypothetical protein B0J13DRAFT_318784 [Dactylonectria estremocensis]
MVLELALSSKKRDRTKENFTRAVQRLMRRCDQLSGRYGADFYIMVRQYRQHYDYNSSKDPSFPTPLIEIERAYPLAIKRTPATFQERGKGLHLGSTDDSSAEGLELS